jgi:hypothetical protein
MFDEWEQRLLQERAEGLIREADAHLNGALALEPNDPERETQVNRWTDEERRARALLAKLNGLRDPAQT